MKNFKYISLTNIAIRLTLFLCLITCVFFLSSCEEWLDINDNPNVPDKLSYEELLPSGISSIAYVMGGRYQVLGAIWSQHWTQSPGASQYSGIDSYDINSSSFDNNQFRELYAGALQNLEETRILSLKDEEYNYYLIATVMQCYAFQVLTDLYNQIPFSEALKGDEDILEPKYETGEAIYDSLIARLDYALSLDYEKEGLKDPETRDLVFNGHMDSWIAFANTLKLRIFLRQTEVFPVKAQQGIEAMYAADADFLTQDANLDIYTNESGRRNPLYDTEYWTFSGNPNLILSNTLYSFLTDNNDYLRLNYLFTQPAIGGDHKALVQGNYYAPEEAAGINSNSYSKPVANAEDPVYLMSASEAFLLQTEAIVRYKVEDYSKAKEHYDNAMLESYTRILEKYKSPLEIKQLAESMYSFPSEGVDLKVFIESIAMQKWLTLSGIQNLETFFETNRTGYPKKSSVPGDNSNYEPGELTVSVNNVTSGKFPQRLIFPESEYANNRNTPAKKEVWEKIWWNTSNN